ncbi:DUF1294 domain-containing protein [Marinomonas spartinae]|uniref:DUF1294 domain-containing protein n=1 Tax=Marinomonas spartinae TaxID=1792290 RepID=UPI000B1566EB|nr:DUF1294 domain-containing protein [Marinomonas spartinae]
MLSYPIVLLCVYGVMSAVTFCLYGWDKSAAKKQQQRTPEKTLHWFSLLGGWPGALLGQKVFRHKTQKRRFRVVFWLTVVFNLIMLAGLCFFLQEGIAEGWQSLVLWL